MEVEVGGKRFATTQETLCRSPPPHFTTHHPMPASGVKPNAVYTHRVQPRRVLCGSSGRDRIGNVRLVARHPRGP
jgi:hypothetical protein